MGVSGVLLTCGSGITSYLGEKFLKPENVFKKQHLPTNWSQPENIMDNFFFNFWNVNEKPGTKNGDRDFHRHSRWLYIQQQSSSSSSNRFIEHMFNKTIAGRRRTLLLSDRDFELLVRFQYMALNILCLEIWGFFFFLKKIIEQFFFFRKSSKKKTGRRPNIKNPWFSFTQFSSVDSVEIEL